MHHQKFIEGKVKPLALIRCLVSRHDGGLNFSDGFRKRAGGDGCGVWDWNTLSVLCPCWCKASKLLDPLERVAILLC
jgi:hypothetical protein